MRKLGIHVGLVSVLLVALAAGSYALADGGKKEIKADQLVGYQENPDISTVALGNFEARIDDDAQTITFELSYSGLEGTVQQAHIHFGKRAVNGGVSVFLCTNVGGPAGIPACPQSGTVTGERGAVDVIGPTGQGIEAGAFGEIVTAIRAGHAYVNVHTTKWPGGEIRAQLNDQRDED
ncbi:MAG: CHRD domain-containing protein [Gaiellaceae bacterium]